MTPNLSLKTKLLIYSGFSGIQESDDRTFVLSPLPIALQAPFTKVPLHVCSPLHRAEDDSVALLAGLGKFPYLSCRDLAARDFGFTVSAQAVFQRMILFT